MWMLLWACAPSPVLRDVPLFAGGAPTPEIELGGARFELSALTFEVADLRLYAPAQVSWFQNLGTARAHPGHDNAGDVLGELLGNWELDLLADPALLGEAQVYSGELAQLTFTARTARLVGHRTLGGQVLGFDLSLDLEEEEISGVPLSFELSPEGAVPTLTLLGHALAMLELSLIEVAMDTDGDGSLTLTDSSLANSLPYALLSTLSWSASAQSEEP